MSQQYCQTILDHFACFLCLKRNSIICFGKKLQCSGSVTCPFLEKIAKIHKSAWEVTSNVFHHPWHIYQMEFYRFFSSSKDFTFDFSMSHCHARYRSEEISPPGVMGAPGGAGGRQGAPWGSSLPPAPKREIKQQNNGPKSWFKVPKVCPDPKGMVFTHF